MIVPVIANLVQYRDALKQAQVGSPDAEAADLQLRLDAATDLVCHYIKDRHPADPLWIAEIEAWDPAGSPAVMPPPVIVLAVLEQAVEFYRFRGDDVSGEQPDKLEYGPSNYACLSQSIEALLSRFKNRAFA